jgi:hypothetical protein
MPIDVDMLPDYVHIDADAHQTIIEAPGVGRVEGVQVEIDST